MANALSLGQAEVLSHLGQPLHVSVPLRATTEELWTTEASIASKEEFELLSIDYQSHFSNIQVLIHSYKDAHQLVITSKQAFNKPFIQLPIAVESSDGRQIKTFSLLIDPISYSTSAINTAPLVQKPMPIGPKVETETQKTIRQSLTQPELVRTSTSKPVNTAKKTLSSVNLDKGEMTSHQVAPGESLWRIARRYVDSREAVPSMMSHIHQTNQTAFVRGDINMLMAGSTLSFTTTATLDEIVETPEPVANQKPAEDQMSILAPQVDELSQSQADPVDDLAITQEELAKATIEREHLQNAINDLHTTLISLESKLMKRDEKIAEINQSVAKIASDQALPTKTNTRELIEVAALSSLGTLGVLGLGLLIPRLTRKKRLEEEEIFLT
jgi:Tfp pilus assembly protein FimV